MKSKTSTGQRTDFSLWFLRTFEEKYDSKLSQLKMPSMKYKDIFYLCSFYHNAIFYSSFVNLWIVCDQLRGGRNQLATNTLHHVQFVYLKQYWEETLSRATQTNRRPAPCTAFNLKWCNEHELAKKNSSHLINSRFCVIIGLNCIPVPCII